MSKPMPPEKRELFLEQLRIEPNVSRAARLTGFCNTTLRAWRERDPEFAKAWDEAIQTGIDAIEEECHRRAVRGVQEDVYHQGVIVGQATKYSDGLLTRLLEARRPDRWRAKGEVTLNGSVALQVVTGVPTSEPSIDDLV